LVGTVSNIQLNQVETNPFQPRTDFDEESLKELAASIKEQGIIQPITVRKLDMINTRLFRASGACGLQSWQGLK